MVIPVLMVYCLCAWFCVQPCLLADSPAAAQPYSGNFKTVLTHVGNPENVSVYVNKITFSSDVPLGQDEFFYITQLKPNSFVTKRQIDRAYKLLKLKKRFSAIAIDLTDEGTSKHLHVTLQAQWIFKKLEFDGVWFGKPTYATLYLQQPGDVFDVRLHEESVVAIKNYLHELGYFSCIVNDEINYSAKFKAVTVNIKVRRNNRFTVKGTRIEISDLEHEKDSEKIKTLKHDIASKFKQGMKGFFYSKKLLSKTVKKIKTLMQDEGFVNAQVSVACAIYAKKPLLNLVLKIKLGRKKVLTVEGNSLFSDQSIKDMFLKKDMPDWLFSSDIIAQQLLHEYYKKGFWHTHIKPRRKKGDAGYHFIIQEGKPAFIKNVEVVDAVTHFPERSTQILSVLLTDKKCDQSVLDNALDRLANFYHTSGYWDFAVVDKNFVKDQNTGNYSIKVSINKGMQRLWAGFSIDDFKSLESEEFFKRYKAIRPNQRIPFNVHWLEEQRDYLLRHFKKLGYWYASVEPELVVLPQSQVQQGVVSTGVSILVQWKIKKGACVKFGKTIVRGATTVPFDRIKRQLDFKENGQWNRDKLERTRKRLKRLDVFKTVNVQPYQLSKRNGKKPIIVTLVDDDPVELRARVGYFLNSRNVLFKQQSTPKFGGSFIIKNPTNSADRLDMSGDWTKFERKFSLDYRQPSPWGIPAMGTLKGFATKYVNPAEIYNSGSAYQALDCGVQMGLGDQFKECYHWNVNAGNQWVKITRVQGNLKFDKSLINTSLPYLFLEPSLEIDKLDSRENTTKGSLSLVSVKMMVPEDDGQITAKLMAEQSVFLPAYKKFIIAAHARVGHIFRQRFEKILPSERFYLGGPYSVRGYEPNALPPLGVTERIENGKAVKDYTIQGGSTMANASLELRFPIYQSFGAVLFQDVGILSQSGLFGLKDRWYPGSGFGFRYKTPIGSVRFDIGWKWKRRLKEDTKSYAWYLTLGEAF